jgi:hypothetical protein
MRSFLGKSGRAKSYFSKVVRSLCVHERIIIITEICVL